MKKNILFIFLFLIFPLSVYADSMELKCKNNDNKQIICEINGISDDNITEIAFQISNSKNINIAKININDEWKIINNTNDNILITGNTTTTNFKIGEIIFTNQNEEEGYIGIESIKYRNNINNEIMVNDIKKNIPLSNNDSLLKNIIIDNYLINFKPDIYEYNLRINNEDKLNILVLPEDNNTKYEILNNHDLINDTEIKIVTNSITNNSTTYTIKIAKEVVLNNEYYLYIYIGIISLIVIINIARLISSRKK